MQNRLAQAVGIVQILCPAMSNIAKLNKDWQAMLKELLVLARNLEYFGRLENILQMTPQNIEQSQESNWARAKRMVKALKLYLQDRNYLTVIEDLESLWLYVPHCQSKLEGHSLDSQKIKESNKLIHKILTSSLI